VQSFVREADGSGIIGRISFIPQMEKNGLAKRRVMEFEFDANCLSLRQRQKSILAGKTMLCTTLNNFNPVTGNKSVYSLYCNIRSDKTK
jgi:hypothetical protein